MEVIKSNKGSTKLSLDGYFYTKKKSSKTTIRWECSKRGSIKCTGAVITDLDIQDVKKRVPHTHEPDPFATEVLKVMSEIMAAAEEGQSQPSKIIADKFMKYPKQVRSRAGKINSLKRQVRRIKSANARKEPSNIQEIPSSLPQEYTTTGGTEESEFLIYVNKSTSDRVLVFGSESGLDILSESHTWFMDGTHGTAPSQFSQLFVIRVPCGDTSVSCIYALLPSKEQSAYEEMLSALLDVCLVKNLKR